LIGREDAHRPVWSSRLPSVRAALIATLDDVADLLHAGPGPRAARFRQPQPPTAEPVDREPVIAAEAEQPGFGDENLVANSSISCTSLSAATEVPTAATSTRKMANAAARRQHRLQPCATVGASLIQPFAA
jgi:hypothetical protein